MNDTLKVMKGLVPTHITYNGKKGALTGKNAMTAKVGETVLFIHISINTRLFKSVYCRYRFTAIDMPSFPINCWCIIK
jgi:hypothetical protein